MSTEVWAPCAPRLLAAEAAEAAEGAGDDGAEAGDAGASEVGDAGGGSGGGDGGDAAGMMPTPLDDAAPPAAIGAVPLGVAVSAKRGTGGNKTIGTGGLESGVGCTISSGSVLSESVSDALSEKSSPPTSCNAKH